MPKKALISSTCTVRSLVADRNKCDVAFCTRPFTSLAFPKPIQPAVHFTFNGDFSFSKPELPERSFPPFSLALRHKSCIPRERDRHESTCLSGRVHGINRWQWEVINYRLHNNATHFTWCAPSASLWVSTSFFFFGCSLSLSSLDFVQGKLSKLDNNLPGFTISMTSHWTGRRKVKCEWLLSILTKRRFSCHFRSLIMKIDEVNRKKKEFLHLSALELTIMNWVSAFRFASTCLKLFLENFLFFYVA